MATFTLFGGAEIEMHSSAQMVITLFGGTDVFYPTVTQAILQLSESQDRDERAERTLILTVFGGVSINRPLIGREYMDLKRLLAPGGIALDDFRLLWMQRAARPLQETYRAITIFGACELVTPKKRHEMDELERLRRTDAVDTHEFDALSALVGHDRNAALAALPDIATRRLATS